MSRIVTNNLYSKVKHNASKFKAKRYFTFNPIARVPYYLFIYYMHFLLHILQCVQDYISCSCFTRTEMQGTNLHLFSRESTDFTNARHNLQ